MTDVVIRERNLIGHPAEVANVLRSARARGALVDAGQPARLPDGRVRITIRLREPVPLTVTSPRRRGVVAVTVGAVGVVVVVVGLVVIVARLLAAAASAAAAAAPTVIGVLAVVGFFLALLGRKSSSNHCPGCKR